jgi:hypothetical protein
MNEKDLLYVALGGATVVITLLVGFFTGWNLVTLLVGVVLVGAVLALRFLPRLLLDPETPVVRPYISEARPNQVKVGPVSLETATPEFRMMFSATVLWQPSRQAEPAASPPVRLLQSRTPPVSGTATTAPGGADERGTPAESMSTEPTEPREPVPAEPLPTHSAPAGSAPVESTPIESTPEASLPTPTVPAYPAGQPEAPASPPPAAGSTPGQTTGGRDEAGQMRAGQRGAVRNWVGESAWHADLGALATAATVERAAEIVRSSSAGNSGETGQQLAKDLVWARTDATGTVHWCAQDVELEPADPADAERLRTWSRLRKQVQEWEHKREYEKNLREYLGDDALKTGGTALVWWLARHLDDDQAVQAAVRLIQDLSTLSRVAQDSEDSGRAGSPFEVPASGSVDRDNGDAGRRDLVVVTRDLLQRLFPDSDDQRTTFARHLASIAERSDRVDYATRVRTLYGVPDLDGDPPRPPG